MDIYTLIERLNIRLFLRFKKFERNIKKKTNSFDSYFQQRRLEDGSNKRV